MSTHGVTALIALALAGGVGAGALGWVCAPWLRTLVPPPARGERWFLARPAVASCGVMAWVVALLAARGLGEFAALPAAAVVLGAATAASLVDAAGHRLPNVLVLRGWALAVIAVLVAMPWLGSGRVIAALGSSALAWAVFAALALASPRSMGWGDVKLVGLLTLVTGLFGPAVALAGVLLAFVLGGMAALALVLRRKAGAGTPLAFGPWLLAGACVVMAGAAFGTA